MDQVESKSEEVLLRDDHPLLERFQAKLKEHLLRVQAKLEEECTELQNSLKTVEEEKLEVGANLYDVEQQLQYQQRQLNEYDDQIKQISEERLTVDEKVAESRAESDQVQAELEEITKKYQENLVNVENMTNFVNHLQQWHEEAENALKVAKRITKKDAQAKREKVEAKRKMDIFILTLENEIRRKENELSRLNDQIKESAVALDKFEKNLTDANTDLEVLQNEHKQLTQAWGEVIVSIQQRDKTLAAINKELHQEHEKNKDLKAHIEGTKKAIQKQSLDNEKLEGFVNRLTGDLESVERQLAKAEKELDKVTQSYDEKVLLMEQTEVDLKKSKLDGLILENQLKGVKKKIELQAKQNLELEEKILDSLQNHICSEKAGKYRVQLLRELQEKRRNTEILISGTENTLSTLMLELERVRGSVARYKEMTTKYQADEDEMKFVLTKQETDLRGTLTQISLRQKTLDSLVRKLDEVVAALGGREVNPDELRIAELKQDIVDLGKKMADSQAEWMKLQQQLAEMNEKRSAQTNEIIVATKQEFIIEQKYRRIESELAGLNEEEQTINRQIKNLNTKLDILSSRVFSKTQNNKDSEKECERFFDKMYDKLKEEETGVLQLEEELKQLAVEMDTLKGSVVEKNREVYSWEEKYKSAMETKRLQDDEAAVDGEINCMKTEIHRMEVRHNQLKRAQQKLMQDLDNCVLHREKIFDKSLVREKVAMKGRRSNIEDKIKDIRTKTRQINQDANLTEASVKELTVQQQALEADVQKKEQEIVIEKQKAEQLRVQIEEGQLVKHENLELIVKYQRRTKRYKSILMKGMPPKFGSEASIDNRLERQTELQDQLAAFLESLVAEFPDKKFAITKIMRTLKTD